MSFETMQTVFGAVTGVDLAQYRPVAIGSPGVRVERRGDAWYLSALEALGDYPRLVTDRLESGARAHPGRWLVARRNAAGAWVGISYAQMLARARAIGQALLDRGLSVARPVMILSGNDLAHLQLAFGAMWAGIPYAPVSPAYSLISRDFGKLRHAVSLLNPGLIFVSDAAAFAPALDAVAPDDAECVATLADAGSATPGAISGATDSTEMTDMTDATDATDITGAARAASAANATPTAGMAGAAHTANATHANATRASPADTTTPPTATRSPRKFTPFADLLRAVPTSVDDAHRALCADTIAKFLFTSGSTSLPKAVPTTHRMLCSNQQMQVQTFPDLLAEPPVIVDWLPWNHTFGGSHNVGIALYGGGTFYIDDGKPMPGKFAETVRNLREIAPTIHFNVPRGWEELADALETDAALRETFLSRVKVYYFAGAGLAQATWQKLEATAYAHRGERIRIMAGIGMTETSPSCLFTTGPVAGAGYVGLPAPGCELKLAPVEGKLEARYRGPHVMRGYWNGRADEKARAQAFDDEGYYRSGDALRFVDEARPELGLMFDGRIAEDFKLSSGTFVSVGPLRARVLLEGAPWVQDVAITGLNRDDVGLLVFPALDACRQLAASSALLPATASVAQVLSAPAVRARFRELMTRINAASTGSATWVARLRLMDVAPSLDRGEVTDKGSLNQRAVLAHYAQQVDALYAVEDEKAACDPLVLISRR